MTFFEKIELGAMTAYTSITGYLLFTSLFDLTNQMTTRHPQMLVFAGLMIIFFYPIFKFAEMWDSGNWDALKKLFDLKK